MSFNEYQRWRYATKKFDPLKRVSDEDLFAIKEAVRLSASSYGLQPYKVLVIESQKLRAQLREYSKNQDQVTDASHLFVFCNQKQYSAQLVEDYIAQKSNTLNTEPRSLYGYSEMINKKLQGMSPDAFLNWTARQTYIALGNLISICAERSIDSCPIEGFEPNKFNKILNLEENNLNALVLAAVGYRSKDDPRQYEPKTRKPLDQIFELIQ